MDAIWSVLIFLGSSVCHQLPERSYFYGDLQMPLCARCIGIHFGFLVSALFLMLGPKRFCSIVLGPKQLVILGVIMSVFAIDGSISYLGISQSDNLRRTLSGLALGIPLPFFLLPFINSFVFPERNRTRSIETSADWLALPGLYLLGAGAVLLADANGVLFYIVSSMGIIGMFSFFSGNASMLALLGFDKSRITASRRLILGAAAATGVLLLIATIRQLLFG
ncbi:MAG: hypothetical protein A3K60_04405 [Euryarchaeota archaeon RBG_19FT_COMBO_56_21]|nr:MAG: hypothetical protein A3K60_04405 [Euryarchaeota archaeon RBG_19FT_COMBO_56_21]